MSSFAIWSKCHFCDRKIYKFLTGLDIFTSNNEKVKGEAKDPKWIKSALSPTPATVKTRGRFLIQDARNSPSSIVGV
jgi:hypothetical protein